jgi:hypothetical protein
MSKLYVKSRSRFHAVQTASAVSWPFPTHSQMRLAQLSDSAPAFGKLQPFYPESMVHLQGYRPNMIVGTASELQHLAGQVDLGTVDPSTVDHALIVLTRCGQPPVSDVARVVLWQTFGVPVYEIYCGLDNSILGYECELHEGWHLAPGVAFAEMDGELMLNAPGVLGLHTSLSGFVTNDKCPCGRQGPRALNVEPIQRRTKELQRTEFPWAATA